MLVSRQLTRQAGPSPKHLPPHHLQNHNPRSYSPNPLPHLNHHTAPHHTTPHRTSFPQVLPTQRVPSPSNRESPCSAAALPDHGARARCSIGRCSSGAGKCWRDRRRGERWRGGRRGARGVCGRTHLRWWFGLLDRGFFFLFSPPERRERRERGRGHVQMYVVVTHILR